MPDKPKDYDGPINPKDVPFWCSCRLGLAAIGCMGFFILYALRINISVALVCMVNHTATEILNKQSSVNGNLSDTVWYNTSYGENNTSFIVKGMINETTTQPDPTGVVCPGAGDGESDGVNGEFIWSKDIQGHILGSFFYGYLATQIPGGWLAERFGGKWVFGISMLIASIATIFCPIAARVHWGFLIFMRILVGLGSGVAFPVMHTIWANWAPPMERSKLTGLTYAGTQLGNILTLPLGGFLCQYGFDGGWASIFYILGLLGVIWCILWLILVSNSPADHPRISAIERDFILQSLKGQMDHKDKKHTHIPWKAFLTSMPLWAIVVGNVTSDWGLYTFLTNMPTYFKEVLKFDIKSNGLISAIPYIGFWLVINLAGLGADLFRKKGWLSTTNARKLMETIGQLIPAILLVGLSFVDCTQPALAVTLLTLGVAISGAVYSGYTINHVDIAPKYAGMLFGITNTIASVTGFIVPVLIGSITSNSTREEWQVVFFIAAAVYLFGVIFYGIFASGDVQPWAVGEEEEEEEEGQEMEKLNKGDPDVVTSPPTEKDDLKV
ncbi:sialin isoform X2 [Lingula anatina]|uniref:Sialin isoform X2 n=1 Tax=Lingula anatina TaxID=7574 RepID=A0A1S3GXU6_LINAN|nr:sialin isoform X2 [Lingula anatina]|eukprot:XP_013378690.1 sialin isoform X2 [Lingula anatina]